MSATRYVSATRHRWTAPRRRRGWYRCPCGRWWGKNKKCQCVCGAPPRPTEEEAREGQARQAKHLAALRWIDPASIEGYMFRGEPLRYR